MIADRAARGHGYALACQHFLLQKPLAAVKFFPLRGRSSQLIHIAHALAATSSGGLSKLISKEPLSGFVTRNGRLAAIVFSRWSACHF
ncbi:MAG: hypothetical protein Q7T70_08805 [Polaromonas sp.]|nr:hypothetical protein [Polaromonas sp.]